MGGDDRRKRRTRGRGTARTWSARGEVAWAKCKNEMCPWPRLVVCCAIHSPTCLHLLMRVALAHAPSVSMATVRRARSPRSSFSSARIERMRTEPATAATCASFAGILTLNWWATEVIRSASISALSRFSEAG